MRFSAPYGMQVESSSPHGLGLSQGRRSGRPDWVLALLAGLLLSIGLVFLYSASSSLALDRYGNSAYFVVRQLRALGVGLLGALVAYLVPIGVYRRYAKRLILISILSMLAVYLPGIGSPVGRFHRWINLGVIQFQPVELAKLAVILYAAQFLSSDRKDITSFSRGVLPHVLITAVFVFLLLLQPDFGSAVLLCAVVFGMLLAGGARLSHLGFLSAFGTLSLYLLIASDPYRRDRVLTFTKWFHGTHERPDDAGYQIWQAYDALSTGGLWGGGAGPKPS
ncbi:MAG: hypothetical protein KatS3mg115_0549 [Candidatus Poribacteria bacterium]|nr:MAG: hypothetical protein KatS3mg115_0549 [Candidatus Poribacteria bacterium]